MRDPDVDYVDELSVPLETKYFRILTLLIKFMCQSEK